MLTHVQIDGELKTHEGGCEETMEKNQNSKLMRVWCEEIMVKTQTIFVIFSPRPYHHEEMGKYQLLGGDNGEN